MAKNDPYIQALQVTGTVQTKPAHPDQKKNNAGGYSFTIDNWTRLDRFLILGSVGGTYYVNQKDFTEDCIEVVDACIREDGVRLVNKLVEISTQGRAPKTQPTLVALALASIRGDLATRQAAYAAIGKICRTGTHLFTFMNYRHAYSGHKVGAGLRKALNRWYLDKPVDKAALQAIKYRQREGWTHRDILRTSHPQTDDPERKALFDFICGREANLSGDNLRLVEGYQKAQEAQPRQLPKIIAEYGLPWEAIPTTAHNEPAVWEAAFPDMGITATFRNLNRFTKLGLLPKLRGDIISRITNTDILVNGRVHPLFILNAMNAYRGGGTGHYERLYGYHNTNLGYDPDGQIIDAMDDAFYKAFKAVEPTNKRTYLGIDVSGSMYQPIAGTSLSARTGSMAMALITARTEPNYELAAFSNQMIPITISPRQRLDDVMEKTDRLPWGGTDCSLPMIDAAQRSLDIDTFVVYTDNETWAGRIHPHQALRDYRNKTGIDARLVVVGMTATEFTIADSGDSGMMDVVGFDTATPDLISRFSLGTI